ANRKTLLFELSFYRKRINLELYHALSDGVGALQFLKTIICYYLLEKYRGTIDGNTRLGDNDASNEQRSGDAFDKYYSKEKPVKIPKLPHAYRIKGERFPESRLGVIEGHISAAALLQKTHEYHSTMGEFLAALLICSIHEAMKIRDENRPVSLTIPVDLRRYFATPTARNFFSTINVSHDFAAQGRGFEDVLAQVRLSFKAQLLPQKIHERLNSLSSLEHTLPIMVVPLAVKAPVLKTAAAQAEKDDSAAFSNIGKITMPPALVPHIRLFSLFTSTKRPHVSITSFEDTLVISFSSPFVSSTIARSFFRTLSGFGLDIEIVSNSIEPGGAQHVVLS
ncbi:MAG: hypothetical protein LBN21_00400, partial [Treponema sp.]|nr:hypothetical protein [Treponema sp.]